MSLGSRFYMACYQDGAFSCGYSVTLLERKTLYTLLDNTLTGASITHSLRLMM